MSMKELSYLEDKTRLFIARLIMCALVSSLLTGYVSHSRAKTPADNPLGSAQDCLAAMSLYGQTHDKAILLIAERAAEDLMQLRSVDVDGRTGWPYTSRATAKSAKCGIPGSLDAFGDGTCNPPETPYMLETGYAIACLAQLGISTGKHEYIDIAVKATKDSWKIGAQPKGCSGCFYYWYSYHDNDRGRFVRNSNLTMALGLAWLYVATQDNSYRDRASSIAQAESFELAKRNFGYFGSADPKFTSNPAFESQRIENHIPHQVKALKDLSIILGRSDLLRDASTLLSAYMDCRNERCRPDNCRDWGAPASCKGTMTIAPCILSDVDSRFSRQCELARAAVGKLNSFQTLSTTPMGNIRSAVGKDARAGVASK